MVSLWERVTVLVCGTSNTCLTCGPDGPVKNGFCRKAWSGEPSTWVSSGNGLVDGAGDIEALDRRAMDRQLWPQFATSLGDGKHMSTQQQMIVRGAQWRLEVPECAGEEV
jgi:hypothetical protein